LGGKATPSPLFLFVSSSPTLSTHQTRPSMPCACTTIFIFALIQQDQLCKMTRKFAHIPHIFLRRYADQETQSPQRSSRSLLLFPPLFFLSFPFFFLFFYSSSRHKSASFIPCHRPARGALRPPNSHRCSDAEHPRKTSNQLGPVASRPRLSLNACVQRCDCSLLFVSFRCSDLTIFFTARDS